MRLCRYSQGEVGSVAFYTDDSILPLRAAIDRHQSHTGMSLDLPIDDNLLPLLPPSGEHHEAARSLHNWATGVGKDVIERDWIGIGEVALHVPIPRPNKLLLLAGNYADHIEEGGERAAERQETFPYVFMKPPSTTLTDPGTAVALPPSSPTTSDHELELAVVMGKEGKGISATDALDYVAGYTVLNDLSDRKFFPNPHRRERPRDRFFDWLHGKWHDQFCPCGPCITSASTITDPQQLDMRLCVNGTIRQKTSTAMQVFSVAEVVEFISSFVTLEPGDIISTGTCAGVGGPEGRFLQPGDVIEATIDGIGTLTTHIVGSETST